MKKRDSLIESDFLANLTLSDEGVIFSEEECEAYGICPHQLADNERSSDDKKSES